jgi:hypothetical protein
MLAQTLLVFGAIFHKIFFDEAKLEGLGERGKFEPY